jgi:hypothetical protein
MATGLLIGEFLKTKNDYNRYIKLTEDEFGTMPRAALTDPKVRGEFKRFRDSFAATPRKANMIWTMLKRIFNVAIDTLGLIRPKMGIRRTIIVLHFACFPSAWTQRSSPPIPRVRHDHRIRAFDFFVYSVRRH